MPLEERNGSIPELKEIVGEASRALALLDSARLEELAFSCQALNRMAAGDLAEQTRIGSEARRELAVFEGVLDATRENLEILRRLRRVREGRVEYCREETRALPRLEAEITHGDD